MNKTYRTVWNASTGTWAAAEETARSKSKGSSRVARKALAAVALGGVSISGAYAADICTTEDGKTGSVDAVGVCQVEDTTGTRSIGTMAGPNSYEAGTGANASGYTSVAVGVDSAATAMSTTALGYAASATTHWAVAIGSTSSASGESAIALGTVSTATGSNSLAIGTSSRATDTNSIAIGNLAASTGANATAIGRFATAGAINATVLGGSAKATGTNAVAVGQSAQADGLSAIGLGFRANAQADNSVALGVDSVANRTGTVSVGSATLQRQIVNVAAGTQATDAVNVAQLKSAIANVGVDSPYFKVNGMGNASDNAVATGFGSIAVGSNALASATNGVAIGNTTTASTDSVAIGHDAQAVSSNGVSIGTKSSAAMNGASLGYNARSSESAVALGANSVATASNSVALGNGAVANTANTVSVGSAGNERKIVNVAAGTLSSASTDTVNGSQLFATNTRVGSLEDSLKGGGVIDPETGESLAVVYDSTAKDQITLGGASGTKLTNVATGAVNATSTDAINGSQLYGTANSVANALGGGSTVGANGNVTAPTYSLTDPAGGAGKVDYHNVGDALTNLDGRVATNTGDLADLRDALHDGGVIDPTTGESLAVVYDGTAKDKVTLGGGTGGTTLANVKAGVADTDAVNVSQLKGSGLIGDDGKAIAAVVYDSAAKDKVTLGGTGATTPVQVKNVANATDANDAVNLSQLNKAVADAGVSNPYIGGRGTGTAAQSTALNAVALGLGSVANQINTISVGNSATGLTRRITNVADGNAPSDAATVGQVSDLVGGVSTRTQSAIDDVNVKVAALDSRLSTNSVVGTDPYVKVDGQGDGSDNASVPVGSYGVAIGADANASGTTGIAIGAAASSTGTSSIAFGTGANATANNAMAFGANSNATGTGATALGNGTNATGNYAVALGLNANAAGTNGLALGNSSNAAGADSVALGTLSNVASAATNSLALGRAAQVQAAATNSVALGAGSVANRINSISVGSVGAERQITNVATGTAGTDAVNVDQLKKYVADNAGDGGNPLAVAYDDDTKGTVTLAGTGGTKLTNVAAGAVNATSTDAINGSQLYGTANSVANALGGGSTVGANGNVTAPTYSLTDPAGGADKVDYHNVGDALTNLDGRVAANTGDLADLRDALHDGGVIDPTTGESLAVVYDSSAKDSVTLGSAGTPVAIHNVADGALSATSKDAVNGSQLFATNTRVGSLEDSLHDGGVIDPTTGESLAVVYDSSAKDKVTLGGGADGTTLSNVKAGVADKDAVNVSQLKGSGLIGDDGKAIAAVTYDRNADGTPNYGSVTLGDGTNPTQLKHVADATDDGDALNLGQLKNAGLVGDDGTGNLTSLAVTYDSATKDSVTLGNAGTPVAIHNVADGALSATSKDAVNGSQLFATNTRVGSLEDSLHDGGVIDPTTGESLAVVYDSTAKDKVTLGGGTGGTTLANVKAGVADTDAVNVSQLKGSGLIGDDGKAIAAVTYDRNADGTPNYGSVTLGDGTNPTQLKHVADATDDGDALNLGQLKNAGLVGDDGTGNLTSLAVTYDSATKDSVTLGGAGTPVAIHNVADGALSATSKDAVNGSQLYATNQSIGDLRDSLHDGGVIDPTTGQSLAVVYDSAAKNKVTLGGTGASTPVVLSNVAQGVAGTDAVNVDQLTAALRDLDTGLNPLAVSYDSAAKSSVTLGGAGASSPVALKNVAAGKDDTDAVNVGQLKDSGLVGDDGSGNLTSLAVTYDDATKSGITLGGAGATTPVAIHNVADGALSATSKDAVNGSQLFATNTRVGSLEDSLHDGGVIDPTTGESLAVVYDSTAKDKVTLGGGADGTTLSNVKAGVADRDAVNVSQLKGSGLIGDDGKAIAAVTYDRNTDGSPNYGSVTLGNGTDPTQLKHVADATDDGDALNLGQLKNAGLVGDDGTGNLTSLAVTYDSATKDSVTLGGTGASTPVELKNVAAGKDDTDAVNVGQLKDSGLVGDDGTGNLTSLAVTYDDATKSGITLGGTGATTPVAIHNVADGALSATSKDAVNGSQLYATNQSIGDLRDSLHDGGVIDPTTGQSLAVVYDSVAKDKVTLGGTGASTPVELKNVAAGKDDTDAVNVGQLKDSGLVGDDGTGNLTSLAVTYDDATKSGITLGGTGATTPVALHNVADGALSATSKDAVNGSQLFATNTRVGSLEDSLHNGGVIDPTTGQSLAVVYDSVAKDKVTLGGTGAATPVQLKNVAAATEDTDAVNLAQLKDAGLVAPVDPTKPGTGLASLAVTYGTNADGSANFDEVKLKGANGTTITNVKAGVADLDAVNVGQLKDAGLVGDDGTGNLTSLAVTYDDATKSGITLGGTGATTPVAIHNVADGALSATSKDAVNGSQLYATNQSIGDLRDSLHDGGVIDPTTGQSLAVVYDSVAKDKVTLGGTGASSPVQLKNVAAGTDDTDAVNVAQLKDAGLVAPVDPTKPGTGLASLAVTYGTNADGSANFDEVKLKGTSGTTITNVAAGAVNATSTDAINGSQLYGTANSVATALGGGSTVDAGGNVTAPTYSLTDPAGGAGKVDYHNVGDALTNLDGRVATNTGDLADLRDSLRDGGVIDPTTGESLAVVYDSTAKDKVTLGGTGASSPVQLKNVAAGTDDTDAVNVAQLKDAGLVGDDGKGSLTSLAVSYDDATKSGITLGGTGATAPVAIHNVADGALSATSKDAVNGSQLFATNTRVGSLEDSLRDGGVIDPTTGQSLAVVYDSATKNSVTLGGVGAAAPVQLKNVAAGTDDTDAVNVAQLKDAGLVAPVDPTKPGTGLASLAVTYGTNADGSANFDEVKLKGTDGTTITNVAAGAVNATSKDAINGSQLYGTAQSVADTIGGGTTVGADGTLGNTAIEVNGQKYSTVAEAVQAAAAYGATDSLAVRYDLNSDGTPNFGSVTLGGSGAAPVRLTNVADGASQYDAVNYGQLSALNDKIGNLDDRVGGLELKPGNPGGGGGGGSGDSPYFGATDKTAGGSSAANPGTGTGNVAAGSGSSIGTGVNNGTAIGSGSTVAAGGGTAIGAGSAAKGENATAIGQGSSATGANSVAIGSGSVATGANTASFGDGTEAGNRRIVNIADGVGANDAATKGQLDRAVGGLAGQINDVSKNAYSGIAAATALTMIPGVDPGKTLSFGVGGATYKGYQAVAFGGEARITQNLKMKAGVGLSSGGNTVGVGASYQW
ncbi:YadA-like family protein [Burkholderia metallica]|uniref:YadA-like family protein n=1 Tax=Burkholderia metallica TaxID=488729 RepID=UPI001CF30516|nr:YadA-like family protein [Burkholderia metallica]MCA8003185.1 YadA-like family protein [Burkholderia metallica]